MDRAYWDSMAERYEHDLLEIAGEAGAQVLREEIGRLADRRHRAADLGCGPGSLLPFLAECFGEVLAVDHSSRLLEVARRRCKVANVSFRCHDLSGGAPLDEDAELVCCVNALIDPDRTRREAMMAEAAAAVRPGGAAIIVVPSFESVFHVYHSLLRCRRRDGAPSGASETQAERLLRGEVVSFAGGVVRVGGIDTKYWMREELLAFLADHGLMPRRVRRVEYAWSEEIDHPPAWLGAPRPWDWLAVGCKGGRPLRTGPAASSAKMND